MRLSELAPAGPLKQNAACRKRKMRHQPQGRNVSEIFGENRSSEEGSRIPLPSVALSELRPSGVLTNKTPLVVNDH